MGKQEKFTDAERKNMTKRCPICQAVKSGMEFGQFKGENGYRLRSPCLQCDTTRYMKYLKNKKQTNFQEAMTKKRPGYLDEKQEMKKMAETRLKYLLLDRDD